jgi:hypothetical protein
MVPQLPPEVLFADEYNRPVFQMGPYDVTALAHNAAIAAQAGAGNRLARVVQRVGFLTLP